MDLSLQNSWQDVYHFAGLALLIIIGILSIFVIRNVEKSSRLKSSLDKLLKSFNDLDEQAKLIVKTDLELNRAQEELDKRFRGLDALQKTSRLISTTLDENEIFQRLNQPLLGELGFEKYLILILDVQQHLHCRVNRGFGSQDAENVLHLIRNSASLLALLQKNQMVASDNIPAGLDGNLTRRPDLKHFVIAPVLAQNNMLGLVIAANGSENFVLTEGDKELVSILADQVGQAVRNARLFEEVYRSRQGLELKVNERTRQLTTALEEVQRINRMKTEFISAVSHELRTPLTSIKGYAAILMAGKVGEIPEQVKERLEKINKHSDNLVKLINDLLDISRIESGRAEMKYARQSLTVLIDNIRDLLAPQMKEKDIRFMVEIKENLPQVLMDAGQIERVLINLVGNAVKFTPLRGVITVRADHEDDKVTIAVTDTGIGIKEEDLSHLFNEFYRVDNEINQNVKGTGLGLSLAKKIVEAHKGQLWVDSRPGKGATFFFTLPLKQATV